MFSSLTHHAYCLVGQREALIRELIQDIEHNGTKVRGNPDFRVERFEVFGIDEARALKEAAERTAVTGGKKIFIAAANSMTREAQNALLKVLEEPPKDTHFFFVLPSAEALLPTLRSRLHSAALGARAVSQESAELAKSFFQSAIPARLKLIAALLKELEKEKEEKRDTPALILAKENIMRFLDALERTAAEEVRGNAGALTEILEAKKYSRDKAPSFKLLLEHLALVLPTM